MQHLQARAAGEIRPSPATGALASKPLPDVPSAAAPDWPAVGLAVAVVAARYGLPLPWAAIVAAAAGLGERL